MAHSKVHVRLDLWYSHTPLSAQYFTASMEFVSNAINFQLDREIEGEGEKGKKRARKKEEGEREIRKKRVGMKEMRMRRRRREIDGR